jgi:mRNA interferase YafQ
MSGTDKYKVKWSTRFKKDYKLAMKRGLNIDLLDEVIRLIAKGDQQQKLIDEYSDHELSGDWKEHRELHIQPDWLLVYYLKDDVLVLTLARTGSHSDLFKK